MSHERHEFFELLDTVKPRWQESDATLRTLALQAGLLAEYQDYLQTPAGIKYMHTTLRAHNYIADNATRKAAVESEITLAANSGFRFRGARQ